MPTTSEQAGRNQLQAYLEQLYGKSSFYNQLISPANTKNMLIQNAAQEDANYRPVSPVPLNLTPHGPRRLPTSPGNIIPKSTSQSNRPLTANNRNRVYTPTKNNGGGMATLTSPGIQKILSNAIPNMKLKPNPSRPSQIGTPNQTIINLEKARSVIENRPHGQSLGKTSLDLDPNLQGQAGMDLSALEAEIRALAGQPDIPGQWISPYSQEYLNQLGDRLSAAGSEAQQQFQGAIGDVVANYGAGTDRRNTANSALVNELTGAGQNIGVNYAASNQGKQAATDADYLNQVSAQNQATDTSFMSKLGELAQFYGGNLSSQAKEGLLTPKQWQGPQSGISSGEQALLGFLQDKYNTEIGRQDTDEERAFQLMLAKVKGGGSGSELDPSGSWTETADEDIVRRNPEFLAAFGSLPAGTMKDRIQELYDDAQGNVPEAIDLAQESMNKALAANEYGWPLGKKGIVPRGASTPSGGGLNLADAYANAGGDIGTNWAEILEFLRKYSSTWGDVVTQQSMNNKSSTKGDIW